MQSHDWIELLRLIPADQQNTLVLTSKTGMDLNVETILRTEMSYLVFRGRVSGNMDDGRVFFLPYSQIDFLQINRIVKEVEIRAMYGETVDDGPGQADGEQPPMSEASETGEASDGILSAAVGDSPGVLSASPTPPSAPTPITRRGRSSIPGVSARLSAPGVIGTGGGRSNHGLTSAAAPPAAAKGNGDAAPPRNSILDRLR